jgi:aryl-alcohol dehydrogenase-like predicted oxidoreductase
MNACRSVCGLIGSVVAQHQTVSRCLTLSRRASRMFNVRLTEEQFTALQHLAEQRHLPMSTMARAWLLDRLEEERPAS